MLKKILTLTLCTMMLLTIVGCGESSEGGASADIDYAPIIE